MNAYSVTAWTRVTALRLILLSRKAQIRLAVPENSGKCWEKTRMGFPAFFINMFKNAGLDLLEPCGSFLLKLAMLVGA